jgi:hypothetical protein
MNVITPQPAKNSTVMKPRALRLEALSETNMDVLFCRRKKETRTPPGILLALIAQAMGRGRTTRLGSAEK